MKVCFIVGTLGHGGAEKQLVFMLRALNECGIESRILCLTRNESYEEQVKGLGVPVEWVGKHRNRELRLLAIIANLRKNPADILQSSHFYTNIYAGLAGRALSIPSIGAIRNDLTGEIELHGFLGYWQVKLPKFLIANSRMALNRAISHGVSSKRIEFVPNVVESAAAVGEDPTNGTSGVVILFVGRLVKDKRPERFIQMAADLCKKLPRISMRFQITGDGEMRNELEKLSRDLELPSDRMEFLGLCKDMPAIYRNADILISTSAREGTPNVVLEAMSHGLAVVATNVGGALDILGETRGILVDPDDCSELVNAVARLVRNDNLRIRLGSAGYDHVRKNHSLEGLKEQLPKIYARLI